MKILIAFVLLFNFTAVQSDGGFKSNLSITDSELKYDDQYDYKSVVVIGNIKNTSDNIYKRIVIEIKFYDKNTKLIDTTTKDLYDNVIPANDSAAFKVRNDGIEEKEFYTSHKIRILSADIKKPCRSKSGFRKFLSDWGGLIFVLFFFAVLIYFTREQQKEQELSKQKFLDLANEQSAEMSKIVLLLEKLVKKS